MIIAFLTFGIPTMILTLNWNLEEEGSDKLFRVFEQIIFQQYLIGLGEFPLDDWNGPWLWCVLMYFVFSTFLVQITMLNMLIAIMQETFSRVYQKQEVSAAKAKLNFVGELSDQIFTKALNKRKEKSESFIFVVKPIDYEQECQEDNKTMEAIEQL